MFVPQMYVCDECGYSRERPGICYYCQNPLSDATDDLKFFQMDVEESLRVKSILDIREYSY